MYCSSIQEEDRRYVHFKDVNIRNVNQVMCDNKQAINVQIFANMTKCISTILI